MIADALRPLADAIKAELRAELLAEVRSEIRAEKAEAAPARVTLSLAEVGARYGIGRIALKRLISTGRIQSIERPCRGGRIGQFLHLADCERVLAGRV